jgi:GTP:adenosylcobinamide-phosphate guanylyltransferase
MIRFGYQSLLVLLLLIIHHVQFCHCVHDLRSWLEKRAGGKLSFLAQDGLKSKLLFRGGDNDNDNELPEANAKSAVIPDHAATSAKKTATSEITQPIKSIINKIKYRRTYDMILDLRRRSSVQGNDESLALRNMITTRANDYITDIREALELNESKITHPRKLLHYLAPKVPAIKQSPDVNLRIHSARSDMDSGVAACIIGTLAHVCEIFDKETMKQSPGKISSSASEVTTDRRFEQLVECVVSGVNVLKRKKQSLTRQLEKNSEEAADIEHILDQENAKEDEGLNVRDACRAGKYASWFQYLNTQSLTTELSKFFT